MFSFVKRAMKNCLVARMTHSGKGYESTNHGTWHMALNNETFIYLPSPRNDRQR